MGTEKRERQKINRQQRLIEEARAERAALVKRNVVRWGLALLLAVGAVVLIAWIGGAFSGDDEADQPDVPVLTQPPADTTPAVTYPELPKPDVVIPDAVATDLVVTELETGDGVEAAAGDTITVYYVGVLSADGTEFDTNYDDYRAFSFPLGQGRVIQGWDQGLVGAQVGDRIQLDIPADLAYGDTGSGPIIQPGDALTFVVDVLEITPGATE